MEDKPTEGMGEDPTWTEVQSGICVDDDTGVPFAVVLPQEWTCAERRAIVDMTWSVYSCWVGFDRKAHAQRGAYFQLGKANGHEWFKTGRKPGLEAAAFVQPRRRFRVQARRVEECFAPAYTGAYGKSIVGLDKSGRRSMGGGISSRRGMVTVNFNPLWHTDPDGRQRWTSCASLGGGRSQSRFGFAEYRLWIDLQRGVAWSFRGKAVVHGTWNKARQRLFKNKHQLARSGNIAWGVHP